MSASRRMLGVWTLLALWGFTGPSSGDLFAQDGNGSVTITGEQRRWHKVTLTLDGPQASESGTPNPFLDYDMKVTFTNGSLTYVVPGYFAADGNAANSSATSGTKWRAHLCPDNTGTWNYSISFKSGANVAVNGGGTAVSPYHGKTGSFSVAETDKTGRDHRGKGRLQYVGKHHLRHKGNGEYFLKQGADAPENLFAYADFDGGFKTDGQKDDLIKTWSAHVGDWKAGDPTWKSGMGKGLIGAVNYLASEGMNVFSFLTMNINGDDRNVFPYLTYGERVRMDVSRLAQWEIVMEHADKLGMYLHFKTQETENELLLDGGNLGTQRKLYYRELIARFAHHLALNWNLGEEINDATTAQKQAWAQYFYDNDPYRHHIVIHNGDNHYDLLGGASKVTGFSLQTSPGSVFGGTKNYIDRSVAAGKPWVVAWDETNPAGDGVVTDAEDYWHDVVRAGMWGHMTAGGAGCEYYFGYNHPHSDLTCQDFRSRDHWWDMARFCLQFFKDNQVPFWDMQNEDALTSSTSDHCLRKAGDTYVSYLPAGGTTSLNLSGVSGTYSVRWFDPRNGGALKTGSVSSVSGGGSRALGNPPSDSTKDWVILVKRTDTPTTPPAAPGGLTATAVSSSQINLSWTDNSSNESDFEIQRKTGASGTWSQVATVGENVTTFNNTGLTPSTTYYYRVRATNAAGDSAWSNEASATTPAAPAGQAVTSLTLINADTDADIGPLANGATLNLATLPTRNLNVRANTDPATVGSVRFGYDGNANYRTENVAPYALEGDSSGDYAAWTPTLGQHTVTATPYSGSGASGTVGIPLSVTFTVLDQIQLPEVSIRSVVSGGSEEGPMPATMSVSRTGSTAGALAVHYSIGGTAANGTDYQTLPTSLTIPAGQASATLTVMPVDDTAVEGTESVQITLLSNSAYTIGSPNSAGVTIADNDSAPPPPPPPDAPRVTALTLIDADADTEIGPLVDGSVINFAALPTRNLSVRADTDPSPVGSVRFALDGNANFQTENYLPYAIQGDSSGDYNPWTPSLGAHTLTVTPYTERNAGGTAGTAMTVAFTVVDQAAKPEINMVLVDAAASEQGPDPGVFEIFRSTDGTGPLTVKYTVGGTAANGTDYAALGGSAVIPTGALSVLVTVAPVDDAAVEGDETVVLTIAPDAAYTVGSLNSDTLVIADNDAAPPPPPDTQAVTALILVDADTDLDIGPLRDGDVLNLLTLPSRNLNVRAETEPAIVGSVRFEFDGNANYKIENVEPYALAGNSGSDYNPWTPSLGSHVLTAVPYSARGATGAAGTPLTARFTVIEEEPPPPPSPDNPAVTGFVLVNADTDADIGPLREGDVLNLSALPTRNLNVRAETAPATVGSVRFSLDGNSNFRTENAAPYALNGDRSGDYYPWTPGLGAHGLTATPYTGSNAGGAAGTPKTVSFTVIDSP